MTPFARIVPTRYLVRPRRFLPVQLPVLVLVRARTSLKFGRKRIRNLTQTLFQEDILYRVNQKGSYRVRVRVTPYHNIVNTLNVPLRTVRGTTKVRSKKRCIRYWYSYSYSRLLQSFYAFRGRPKINTSVPKKGITVRVRTIFPSSLAEAKNEARTRVLAPNRTKPNHTSYTVSSLV